MYCGFEGGVGQIWLAENLNTDQGPQFTSYEFAQVLKGAEVKISMDGKGRCRYEPSDAPKPSSPPLTSPQSSFGIYESTP